MYPGGRIHFFSGRIHGLLNLFILLRILSDHLQAVCTHTHTYAFVCASDNTFFHFPSQALFIHSLSLLVLFPSILRGNICFVPPFPLLPSIQNNKQLRFPISLITFFFYLPFKGIILFLPWSLASPPVFYSGYGWLSLYTPFMLWNELLMQPLLGEA